MSITAVKAAEKIEELIAYANDNLYLKTEDNILIRNGLLAALDLKEPSSASVSKYGDLQSDILNPLLDYAEESGLIGGTETERILHETRIMGILAPLPSFITERFDQIALKEGVAKATDFLNDYSVKSNYIRSADIEKNLQWETAGKFGKIIVTINCGKPEKDPKDIERAKNTPRGAYPKCPLCKDNVGFSGDFGRAARQTLRTVPILLNNENWQLQFSPYVYYQKHCIALSDEHKPMKVDRSAFIKMFDFVDLFRHFFIGSNAALPIVGGSILAHDHFQGGDKVLPMFDADDRRTFKNVKFRTVSLSVVDWYNSVIRLKSKSREDLINHADHILCKWSGYRDENSEIIPYTGETPHNAVTPVARLEDDGTYILDMILRNNRTNGDFPFGIFHPPAELHNIKKEGIGIIEVMGLFILPGRLYGESHEIAAYLSGEKPLIIEDLFRETHPLHKHAHALLQLANDNGLNMERVAAERAVTEYINSVCEKILECTAVFKNTERGQAAFDKFIETVI
ncbi:MAG: UDP-glucose--hexose-1-phosphate uridylyltransferase [Clostridiales bacterium]|nr:UDP-glucose--hexose-1-phosphate uridylyltransferase [Clostridiales bacterium]